MSETKTMQHGDDPGDFTVAEVQAYMGDDSLTADEHDRIMAAERAGQGRKGIVGDDPEPEGTTKGLSASEQAVDDPDAVATTKAQTFAEAAEDATPHEGQGFLGTSPERERTGRSDKGLSQANPAILTGGPIPDSRQGVDDSEGLAAL